MTIEDRKEIEILAEDVSGGADELLLGKDPSLLRMLTALDPARARALGRCLKRIELLPYHGLGVHTYADLGREYALRGVPPPDDGHLKRLEDIIESRGVSAQIGG